MPETGVPSALSKAYADPSQAYNFLGNVIPQMAGVAEASKRTGIDQQNANTSAANSQTARLAELRAAKMADATLRKADLDLALDAALFDTNVTKANADLQRTVLMNEVAQRKANQDLANDATGAGLLEWQGRLDPEGLLGGAHDAEFWARYNALQGLDAKARAVEDWNKAKTSAIASSVPVIAGNWGAEISDRTLPAYQKATASGRLAIAQIGNARAAEQTAVHQAQTFLETWRGVAPDLDIDIESYRGKDDQFGNPTYDAVKLKQDVAAKEALLKREAAVVGARKQEFERDLGVAEKQNQFKAEALGEQVKSLRTNIAKLSMARSSGSADVMQVMLAEVLQKSFAEKGIAPAEAKDLNSPDNEKRDKARNTLFEKASTEWAKELDTVNAEFNKVRMTDPRGDRQKSVQSFRTELDAIRTSPSLSPEQKAAGTQALHAEYDSTVFKRDGAANFYGRSTYLIDPERLPVGLRE